MSQNSSGVRAQVRASIKRRGRQKYNVWVGYASKGGSTLFVLDGTPRVQHLIWMEGDPNILRYECPRINARNEQDEDQRRDLFEPDAICVLRTNAIEWRKVLAPGDDEKQLQSKNEAAVLAEGYNAKWRFISSGDLAKHSLLISNWRRGLSYLWAAASYDLKPFEYDISALLAYSERITVRMMLSAYRPDAEALLIAAMFRMAQAGEISTDLGERPFGYATTVRAA